MKAIMYRHLPSTTKDKANTRQVVCHETPCHNLHHKSVKREGRGRKDILNYTKLDTRLKASMGQELHKACDREYGGLTEIIQGRGKTLREDEWQV